MRKSSLAPTHPERVYHPGHHSILHKHTWPGGVGCSFPTSVLCPFCPVLRCGHWTRYTTEHPGTGGMTLFHSTAPKLIPDVSLATPWTQTDPTPQRSAEQTTRHPHPSRFEPAQPNDT